MHIVLIILTKLYLAKLYVPYKENGMRDCRFCELTVRGNPVEVYAVAPAPI